MRVRGIRGATQLSVDSAAEMQVAVGELLTKMLAENALARDDLISVLLTSTPDLTAASTISFDILIEPA